MTVATTGEPIAAPLVEVGAECPVCASKNVERLFTASDKLHGYAGEFGVARCDDCGLLYLNERPAPHALAAYYPADYYAYKPPAAHSLFERTSTHAALWYAVKKSVLAHQYGYRHFTGSRFVANILRLPFLGPLHSRVTFTLDVMLHPFVENGSLLEVGCGSGMYLDLMRSLGWERVVGVDINAGAIAQAQESLGLEAYCGELGDVDFADESFDAVSLSHTLEHIAEPRALLANLYRILRPNGRIAIVVPNLESLASRRFGENWFHLDVPRHTVNFTRHSLALALRRAGFVIETVKTRAMGSYDVALLSKARQAGDPPVGNAPLPPQSLARRAQALSLSLLEQALCGLGRPAGEELLIAARKP